MSKRGMKGQELGLQKEQGREEEKRKDEEKKHTKVYVPVE
jgi:hypothetical protein